MPIRSHLTAALLLGLVTSPAAAAALLIEGELEGERLRILVDAETDQAEVTVGGRRHLVDLDSGETRLVDADGTIRRQKAERPASAPARPEIKPWGPGPTIAGHASVYHVMTIGNEICGELLISPWMKPFVAPAVQAIAILERVKGIAAIERAGLRGACADLPFSSYAAAGWPLMAGSMDQAIFKTEAISFDYRPRPGELGHRAGHAGPETLAH